MFHPDYDETLAYLDINWFKLVELIGALPLPIPLLSEGLSSEILDDLELDGIIFSGGNSLSIYESRSLESKKLSEKRDRLEFELLRCALKKQSPVLGVCRGMQLINNYFNGSCIKLDGHAATRHKIFKNSYNKTINHQEVNSFHNYGITIDGLGSDLLAIAHDSENNIEALQHKEYRILGIMWHPERENPFKEKDLDLIKRHFQI